MRQGRTGILRVLAIAGIAIGTTVVAVPSAAAASDQNVSVPCSGDGGGAAGIAAGVTTLNGAGGGQLTLATDCTYTFTTGVAGNATAKITTAITVVGNQATLSRHSNDLFRFFEVAAGGNLSLLHMTMRGGSQSSGGALSIDQGATASLQSVVVKDNDAQPTGGGIYDEGTLRMEGSVVTHNSVIPRNAKNERTAFGAGVRITVSGTAAISSTDVTDNTLASSSVQPVLGGAGIYNEGLLTVTGSHVKGNSINTGERDAGSAAGAGIGNKGTLTLDHSTVDDNSMSVPLGGTGTGSGVWNAGTFSANASTIKGNTTAGARAVSEGAGVYGAIGKIDLVDTHVTANKASGSTARGGGVGLSDSEQVDVTVKGSPITDNVPDNCFPVANVPTCANTAHRSHSSG